MTTARATRASTYTTALTGTFTTTLRTQAPPRTIGWFLRALFRRLSNYRWQCAALVAALLVDVVFEGVLPLSLKFLIDDAIIPRRFDILAGILIALAVG